MSETQVEETQGEEMEQPPVEADAEVEPDADTEAAPEGDDGPGPSKAKPESVSREHLKSILESLVFVADKPVPVRQLARAVRSKSAEIRPLLDELVEEYRGRGIELSEVAGGFQFRSSAANAPFVRDFVAQKPVRLTRAQLETLAIIAYRQPVTRPEIEEIRGVDSGSALKVLLDRALVKILGRKEEPGRPLLYGTTPLFLEFFGMNSLKDLPTLREFSELTEESRALFERRMGEPIDLSEVEELTAKVTADEEEDEEFDEEAYAAKAEEEARRAADGGGEEGDDGEEGDEEPARADAEGDDGDDDEDGDDDDDEDGDEDDEDDEDEDDEEEE